MKKIMLAITLLFIGLAAYAYVSGTGYPTPPESSKDCMAKKAQCMSACERRSSSQSQIKACKDSCKKTYRCAR